MRLEMKSYDDFQRAIRELTAFLAAQKLSDNAIFDSKLVLHELLGNVLQHANGNAVVGVEVRGDYVHVSVRAEQVFCPPKESRCPENMAERGRGLFLVDSVCAERIFTENGEILVKIRIE